MHGPSLDLGGLEALRATPHMTALIARACSPGLTTGNHSTHGLQYNATELTWGAALAGSEVPTAADSLLSADHRKFSEDLACVLTKALLSRRIHASERAGAYLTTPG